MVGIISPSFFVVNVRSHTCMYIYVTIKALTTVGLFFVEN